MLLGKVVGTVWSTVKEPRLQNLKLLVVQSVDLANCMLDPFVIAVDAVGAGLGETVLVAQGSSARQTAVTKDRPVDAVIMAIVDRLDSVPEADLQKSFEERTREIEARLKQLREV